MDHKTFADVLGEWHPDPSVLLGVVFLTALYLSRARVRREDNPTDAPSRGQITRFLLAMATILVALASPLHELSDHYLFTAHMVQHLLLILVMPLLFLTGLTPAMLRPLIRTRLARTTAGVLTRPVVAFCLCNLVFAASHVPSFYDYVLAVHDAHVVEHLVFMATAVILWWPVVSPLPELPRLSYPLRMLYLFLQTIPGAMVGGFIVNASAPLYTGYVDAPRVVGWSPLVDQQIGSILMWVGGGFFFLVAFTVVFFVWANEEHGQSRLQPQPTATALDRSSQPR